MNRLLLPAPLGDSLRERLLSASVETAGILYAHTVATPSGHRLIYRDFLFAPDEAYIVRRTDRVELDPNFLAIALKRARINRWTVLLTHTHPWHGTVIASDVDLEGERILFPSIFRRVPELPHGRLIIGHKDYDAALFQTAETNGKSLRVFQLGPYVNELSTLASERLVSAWDETQFDRQIRMFGSAGQQILARLCVGIVGLGGTGSIIAQELVHLGVNNFILMDPDTIEQSNLNRVVGARTSDVGRSKVFVAERTIREINPNATIASIVGSANLNHTARKLTDCDFMFICTDSHGSRAVLNQLSYQYYLPAIDMGVRIDARDGDLRITGRIQMLAPGLGCLLCANLLDPEAVRRDLMTEFERQRDPYIVGSPEPQPAVISINGTVSSLAISMFLAAVTGISLKSRYQIYRGEIGTVRNIESKPTPDCVVCSPAGAAGKGDQWDLPGRKE
jgi:molybdopterin-synthase adenylyltransferase